MARARSSRAIAGPADTMNPFMCVGDSITIGLPAATGGYRTKLQARARVPLVLTGRNVDPSNVPTSMHEGYNGYRTDQVLPLVLTAIPLLQPRNIVMMLGVNDINQGESPAATLVEVRAAAAACLGAGDPYLQHVFVSTIPIGATMTSLGGGAFNTGLADAFADADDRIVLIDMCSTLAPPGDFADGLHPNDGGYDKMAGRGYSDIQAVYPAL